jgi:hypothetical protein
MEKPASENPPGRELSLSRLDGTGDQLCFTLQQVAVPEFDRRGVDMDRGIKETIQEFRTRWVAQALFRLSTT